MHTEIYAKPLDFQQGASRNEQQECINQYITVANEACNAVEDSMAKRIEVQPAFVLHAWPYRNTSLLLDVFTQMHGRVGVIARGVASHSKKQLGIKALLQPFQPLLISCQKKQGDLFTLQQVESFGKYQTLSGKALFCGLYLNELLQRLLTRFDPTPEVFELYHHSIAALADVDIPLEPILRRFEKQLLTALGYEVSFGHEAHIDVVIEENYYYEYISTEGYFSRVRVEDEERLRTKGTVFYGQHLLAIAKDEFINPEILVAAKRLLRLALARLLGDKPLKTRQIFRDLERIRQ